MTIKEELHQLVDNLPESQWGEAKQLLEDLSANGDDDPLTPKELAEIDEGRKAIERGEYITLEEYERERGL